MPGGHHGPLNAAPEARHSLNPYRLPTPTVEIARKTEQGRHRVPGRPAPLPRRDDQHTAGETTPPAARLVLALARCGPRQRNTEAGVTPPGIGNVKGGQPTRHISSRVLQAELGDQKTTGIPGARIGEAEWLGTSGSLIFDRRPNTKWFSLRKFRVIERPRCGDRSTDQKIGQSATAKPTTSELTFMSEQKQSTSPPTGWSYPRGRRSFRHY